MFQGKIVCLKMRLSLAKILSHMWLFRHTLYNYQQLWWETITNEKSHLMFRLYIKKNWTTKSRVIHVRISIPKQYQMTMSSVARVNFIKTTAIFTYHTRGVSNQISSNSDHEIKSYSCSNSVPKWEKVRKNFLGYKTGQ